MPKKSVEFHRHYMGHVRELRVGGDVPEECVGVEEQFHRPSKSLKMSAGGRGASKSSGTVKAPAQRPEWSRAGWGGGDRPELGDRAAAADDDEMFPGLDPIQEGVRILSDLLKADGAHEFVLSDDQTQKRLRATNVLEGASRFVATVRG